MVEEQDRRILQQRMKKKDEQIENLKWRVRFTESLAGVNRDFDFEGLVHIDRDGKKVSGPGAVADGEATPMRSSSSSSSSSSTPNKTVIKAGVKAPLPPRGEPPAYARKE